MKQANNIECSQGVVQTAGAGRTRPEMVEMVKIAVIFLTAVICGLGAGYFIGSGGMTPRRAMAASSVCDCRETVESLEPQMRSDGLARHRYIPERRVGPYRSRAVRVVGVDPDGRYVTESVSTGDARQGLRKTFRAAALRKSGKAPLKERYAQTRRGMTICSPGLRIARASGKTASIRSSGTSC